MRHQTTLRFIDTIGRARSIRAAAERLAITPSALNRRLLALEEELGAPLFERQARGVRLSAAGELFVTHARRQMADLEAVRSRIEDMKGARLGRIALGLDASLAPARFAAEVQAYRAEHPRVAFAIEPVSRGDATARLEDYSLDLAVTVEPAPSTGFATLATLELEVLALVAPDHPLADAGEVALHDLLAHPLALPLAGTSLRFLIDMAALRIDMGLSPAQESDVPMAMPLLAAGGVAFGVDLAGRRAPSHPGVRAVPMRARDVPPATLHLCQLRGRSLPIAAAKFADRIAARFAALSGEAG